MEIKIMKNIMHANKKTAAENRAFFTQQNITAINIMASPGAGKTSVILKMIETLGQNFKIYVIEGDIASSIDAEVIEKTGTSVVQINTGGGCHLDASMISEVVKEMNPEPNSLLLIENVGNLVCPSTFDLGETMRLVIASVPEGHDKPFKYISMFESADVVVLNKVDLVEYVGFDKSLFYKGIKAVNQKAATFEVSCRSGEGVSEFILYIRKKLMQN